MSRRDKLRPCTCSSFIRADIGQRLAASYGVPVVKTIDEALTLGTGKLAVEGVLLVAEHGNYPSNEKSQTLYPRYEFFEQVVQVFRKSGRSCPVFVDKHLSYDWKKARQMYDWSRELKFPLMAGSSVSVTFRRPALDPPLGVEMESALAVGGGWVADGGIFHILETLQAFAERRKGGEKGVRAVQLLKGEAAWKAAEDGLWSKELLYAALARGERVQKGRPEDVRNIVAGLVEYRDGFRGAVVAAGGLASEYLAAYKVKGEKAPQATLCYIPTENSNNFSPLVHAIAHMFNTGEHLYPVERTLLTTGALAYLMESGFQGGKRIGNSGARSHLSGRPESLTSLRDWGVSDMPLEDLIDPKAPAEKIAEGYKFTEGPVFNRRGYLLFSDIPNNRIMKWERGQSTVYRESSNGANGLTFDHQGRVVGVREGSSDADREGRQCHGACVRWPAGTERSGLFD